MTRVRVLVLLFLHIVLVASGVWWFTKVSGIEHEQARQKACFANQRVLTGALEMYNLDAAGSGTSVILAWPGELASLCRVLEETRHLRSSLNRPGLCRLFLSGNFDKGGFFYCSVHGWVDDSFNQVLSGREHHEVRAGSWLRETHPEIPEYVGDDKLHAPGLALMGIWAAMSVILMLTPYASWAMRFQAVLAFGALFLTGRILPFFCLMPWTMLGIWGIGLLLYRASSQDSPV